MLSLFDREARSAETKPGRQKGSLRNNYQHHLEVLSGLVCEGREVARPFAALDLYPECQVVYRHRSPMQDNI